MSINNTNQRKAVINGETALFLRGLIIGKVLTLVVIGGLFWWLLKTRLLIHVGADSPSQPSETPLRADSPSQPSETPLSVASTFQKVADVPIGSFNYGGSTAWVPIRQLVDSQIQSVRPELQLHYVTPSNGSPSSTSGIRMLLDGQLDFAESSRPLTDQEYAIAMQRGFTLEQRQVGVDAIAVIVNPSLKVSGLTIDQLQQIYLGQMTNWKQVGGPDLPITPFSQRSEDAGTAIFSVNGDSKKQALSPNVQYVNSTTAGLRQVSETPGGLYYASARAVVLQCSVKPLPVGRIPTQLIPPYREPLVTRQQCPSQRNQINTEAIKNGSYPMTTKLFVIIKHDQGSQQAGAAYSRLLLTDQGQKAIEQAGFVKVH